MFMPENTKDAYFFGDTRTKEMLKHKDGVPKSIIGKSKFTQMLEAKKERGKELCAQPEIEVNNFEILISLLESHESFELVSDKQIRFDIPCLKKYGLPYWQDETVINQLTREKVLQEMPFYGFKIEHYHWQLSKLYSLYRIWLELVYEIAAPEEELLNMHWTNSMDFMFSLASCCTPEGALNKLGCVTHMSNEIKLSRTIRFEGNEPQAYFCCENYMDVAFSQMLDLIATGSAALDGRTLGLCAACGKEYIRHHRNSKHCPDCSSGSERTRRYRARKTTEVEGNGEEERQQ